MNIPSRDPEHLREILDAYKRNNGNKSKAARELNLPGTTFRMRLKKAMSSELDASDGVKEALEEYDLSREDKTPEQAWDEHASSFELTTSRILRNRWRVIERGKGPFVIFHSKDEHLDDNGTPLKLIEHDIKRSHDMGAIMCHGGDALNNWPLNGRLAKKWADQDCTLPDSILRLEHFIQLFKPDVWTDGNHEEMNAFLSTIIQMKLKKEVIQDYWSVNFIVRSKGGRDVHCILAHKLQKGSSWFHKLHGHIREMLEGEQADLYMDGHLHSDGVLDHSLPERGHHATLVASAGYKITDQYAMRISRGGKIPKLRGRAHWIVCDPQAAPDQNLCMAFKCPDHAEAYLNGLQNLRAA